MHDGRPVALVVGGLYSEKTSEILDFTRPGHEWKACKQTLLTMVKVLFLCEVHNILTTHQLQG